jgi:hypothetical protein
MSMSESCLVRVHPTTGGKTREGKDILKFDEQLFRGVSPDVFFELQRDGAADCRRIIRKLNATIQVSPRLYSVSNFIEDFCAGPIERTYKSQYHGDHRSGLKASKKLLGLIQGPPLRGEFTVEGRTYQYHSIGLAMNPGYAAVDHRAGNSFDNHSSHFEIKFIEKREGPGPFTAEQPELLCLNIHFLAAQGGSFGEKAVADRLTAVIRLFYLELGLRLPKYLPQTYLPEAMQLTLSNYKEKGFSIKHEESVVAKEKYDLALDYDPKNLKPRTISDFLPAGFGHKTEKETETVSSPEGFREPKANAWNASFTLADKLRAASSVGSKGKPSPGSPFP